jgi:hypothetical protein
VVNAALALDRRIACNLNYTVSSDVINQCIQQAGIRHVLTTHRFMEKMEFNLDADVVYLEDFKPLVTLIRQTQFRISAFLAPSSWLTRSLKLHEIHGDDLLTVIFTSGSTGMPKGVMLTHANVASNAEAVDQMVHLNDRDVVLGILPFFHSFGYTIAMWTVLIENIEGVYHFNPLDGKQVGKMCQKSWRNHPSGHANLPAQLPAPLRAGGVRVAGRRRGGGGKAAERPQRRLRSEVRSSPGGGVRNDRTLSAGLGKHSTQPVVGEFPGRPAGRIRRTPHPGSQCQNHALGNRRGTRNE